MTKKCLFERSTKLFLKGTTRTDIPHDPVTHVQILLPDYPDRRTDRWDGATDIRAATAQELADYDAAALDAQATRDVDGMKALKALVIWLAPLVGKTPAEARAEIIAIYIAIYKAIS